MVGPVLNMARPRRPKLEAQLVREAAMIVQTETQLTAVQPIASEIARRVVDALISEIDGLSRDPLLSALQRVSNCPFWLLATCPDIDTLSEFVDQRIDRLMSRG